MLSARCLHFSKQGISKSCELAPALCDSSKSAGTSKLRKLQPVQLQVLQLYPQVLLAGPSDCYQVLLIGT